MMSRASIHSHLQLLPLLEVVTWDQGKMWVNCQFADLLQKHDLTRFENVMRYEGGQIAKHVIAERPTTRLILDSDLAPVTLFLKRHAPAKLKEYFKSWIRLRRARLGAVPEWQAIQRFVDLGIATMTPVALGVSGRQSFLLTLAIEGCEKLSDWMKNRLYPTDAAGIQQVRKVISEIAWIARTMHSAGLTHHDFYAGHLLIPNSPYRPIHVLDLGRVRTSGWMGRIFQIKDLAQLYFSTKWFTNLDRFRFLRAYLGRPISGRDRALIAAIRAKAKRIARHTEKHRL